MINYNGNSTGLGLSSTINANVVEDTDPNAAAEFNTPTKKALDWLEMFRVKVKALFDGTLTVKSLHVDNVGQASSSAGSGELVVYGNTTIGGDIGLAGNLTAAGTIGGKRIKVGGTALVAGDFALGAGWGASASVSVAAGSTDTAGSITVTANGAGIAADPRIIMTFKDGTFPANGPVQIVQLQDNDESSNSGPLYHVVVKSSLTAPQWFMVGTPVSGKAYTFRWITVSR